MATRGSEKHGAKRRKPIDSNSLQVKRRGRQDLHKERSTQGGRSKVQKIPNKGELDERESKETKKKRKETAIRAETLL